MSIGTKILDATITVHHDEIQEHNDFMPLGRVGVDESIRISLHDLRTYIGDRSYIINGNNIFRITEDISGAAELVINDVIRLKFTKDAFIPAGDNSYDLGSITYGLKNIYIKGGLLLGSDADGDIYYRHDTKLKRLPIGTSDTFLTVDNGLPHYRLLLASDIPDISDTYLTEEVDPVAMAAIGDRTYTEENYVTSDDTITKSIDDLDKAIQVFDDNSIELPSIELPSKEIIIEPNHIVVTDEDNNIISVLLDTEEKPEIGRQINIEKDLVEKKYTISLDETKVDHNNLLNWEAERHRHMVYDNDLKAYKINN